jgi:CRP/FNR family cyclic AMP-dependent transcriptional regulator
MIDAMSADMIATLRRVPLFAGMSDKELKRLAKSLQARTFEAGQHAAVQGRDGIGFFLIESGEAKVTLDGEEIGSLGPGDWFGEMALIDGGPRSATVEAVTELRCHGMTPWVFRPLVEAHGELAWSMLETLVARLRETQARPGRA